MLEIIGISDPGEANAYNDDRLLINTFVLSDGKYTLTSDDVLSVFALADGVGGSPSGNKAAEITLNAINEMICKTGEASIEHIERVILQANDYVVSYGSNNSAVCGLATTVTGVVVAEDTLTTFNVGDSRVYRYRDGILFQLTKDHSVVQSLIDSGEISQEEAYCRNDRSAITRFIGDETRSRCIPDIKNQTICFEENDILILCSDGLTDYVDCDSISDVLANENFGNAAERLIRAANDAGGYDNISVILVRKVCEG